jgi:hypothetical protein
MIADGISRDLWLISNGGWQQMGVGALHYGLPVTDTSARVLRKPRQPAL